MNKNYNVIIAGVGGQGVITLVEVITKAALIEGFDVKSSELHGLSQRGGSVLTHIRFGKKVYSPLIERGKADLILSLEALEGLRVLDFGNKETKVIVNKYLMPFGGGLPLEEVTNKLEGIVGKNLHLIPASKICQEKLQKEVVSTIYLLGYAVFKGMIPLKKESVISAISQVVPSKHLELNKQAFSLSNE